MRSQDASQFNSIKIKAIFEFTPPNTTHTTSITALGCYDGDESFVVRFMPQWVGHWTYRTEAEDADGTPSPGFSQLGGEFQCIEPIVPAEQLKPELLVAKFCLGDSRRTALQGPGAEPEDSNHRGLVQRIEKSADRLGAMSWGIWEQKVEWHAFTVPQLGTSRYCIGQAWQPHRGVVTKGKAPDKKLWNYSGEFWAYDKKQRGTVRYSVGRMLDSAVDGEYPLERYMMNLDGSGRDMDYDGWEHCFSFWAYPSERAHLIMLGKCTYRWGLLHKTGILDRAFWALVEHGRAGRIEGKRGRDASRLTGINQAMVRKQKEVAKEDMALARAEGLTARAQREAKAASRDMQAAVEGEGAGGAHLADAARLKTELAALRAKTAGASPGTQTQRTTLVVLYELVS